LTGEAVLENTHPKQMKSLSLKQIALADGDVLSKVCQPSPDGGQKQIAWQVYPRDGLFYCKRAGTVQD
jgi:hypothetical protein